MLNQQTLRVKESYDRIAGSYDLVDILIPANWRRKSVQSAFGHVLEIGIGTGLNLPYYTDRCKDIIGVDLSSKMLSKAKQRGFKCKIPTRLEKMDIQTMDLADNQFDSIMSSFVFCTVPDPLQAMRECYRVLRPEGRLILLEHMNSDRSWLRWFIKKVSPLTVKTMGDHIDRDTYITAKEAGFTPDSVENLFLDLVRLIILKK